MRVAAKKRVLHVTFSMEIGGTEQVIRQIIHNADSEKVTHEILCIDGKIGSLGRELLDQGIVVTITRRQAGLDPKLILFIHRLIRERDVDVLHCHQYTPFFYGGIASFGTNVSLIFTEHGRFYPDRHHFKRRFINPVLVWRAQHITTISNATADAVATYEYIRRGKIQVIYNGIEDLGKIPFTRSELLADLGLEEHIRFVGTVARLEPIKNQTMMIMAFHQVCQKMNGIKLIIIGDGSKRSDLQELVKTLGLEQDVIFTGYLQNAQKYIRLFEVFLLSSFSEGTSMTLLEAMSMAKPCIVTAVGGNTEIVVDGKTGWIVPSNDTGSFSNAIANSLLLPDNQARVIGESARQKYIADFGVGRMKGKYQELYLS